MGEQAILAVLMRKLIREFGLARNAVFVAGLSSGGAMAAMHSGASEIPGSVGRTHKRPVCWIIFQGTDDSTVHPSNASALLATVVGDDAVSTRCTKRSVKGRDCARNEYAGSDGATLVENWMIVKSGHAWSCGRAGGSSTDPKGPDASAQMIRVLLTKSA